MKHDALIVVISSVVIYVSMLALRYYVETFDPVLLLLTLLIVRNVMKDSKV